VKDKTVATTVIYLHGLGSSPNSPKARLFSEGLSALGYRVVAPVLSLPALSSLSAWSAFRQVMTEVSKAAEYGNVVILGSSFGGFLASRCLGVLPEEIGQRISGVGLLAPVLYPWHEDAPIITKQTEDQWRRSGEFPIEESASGSFVKVHLKFLEELRELAQLKIEIANPTLVVHGTRDETVPYSHSVEFAESCSSVQLISLDDDHQMMANPQLLLQIVIKFVRRTDGHQVKA